MSVLSFFTRRRHPNPTQGNTQFVQADTFLPGAEGFSAESIVGDPLYMTRVFPQWNFFSFEVTQVPMVFQELSLPGAPPQGFPFGGMRSTNLISPDQYPEIQGDYWS